jgi:hypothetical protein
MDEECTIAVRFLIHSFLGNVPDNGSLRDARLGCVAKCPLLPGLGLLGSGLGKVSRAISRRGAVVAPGRRVWDDGTALDSGSRVEEGPSVITSIKDPDTTSFFKRSHVRTTTTTKHENTGSDNSRGVADTGSRDIV